MEIGNWMRNKETGEAVKITALNGAMVEYGNDDCDGFVQVARVSEEFDVLDDPTERDDIEFLLKAKIEAGEAETGLYDIGLSYVAADRVMEGGKEVVTFQWFDHMIPFVDLIND